MLFPASSADLPDDWRAAMQLPGWKSSSIENAPMRWVIARTEAGELLDRHDMHVIWDYCATGPQIHNIEWSEEACQARVATAMRQPFWQRWSTRPRLPPLHTAFAEVVSHTLDLPAHHASIDQAVLDLLSEGYGRSLGRLYDLHIRIALSSYRWRGYIERADLSPWLRLDHGNANWQCPNPGCSARHSVVMQIGHPLAPRLLPPNGALCRCRIEAVSEYRMARMAWQPSSDDEIAALPLPMDGFATCWGERFPTDWSPPFVDMSPRNKTSHPL